MPDAVSAFLAGIGLGLLADTFEEHDIDELTLFELDEDDLKEMGVRICVEINQCFGCTRQFFTKSPRGDGASVLARSSGEEPASPRHRAGVASMAWRTTRRFSTNAP